MQDLTIQGPGAGQLAVVSGGNTFSASSRSTGATTVVTLSGLTITHGYVAANPGYGGGIFNDGSTLTLSGCILSGNNALEGGAVYNNGSTSTLTVSGCMLSGNNALEGGAVYNSALARATINKSTLSGNIANGGDYYEGDGGGVYNFEGTMTLSGCTRSGNSAGLDGGAIYTYGYVEIEKHQKVIVIGTMTISGCTVTGNSRLRGRWLLQRQPPAAATRRWRSVTAPSPTTALLRKSLTTAPFWAPATLGRDAKPA